MLSFFDPPPEMQAKQARLMQTMDGLNARWGREVLRCGASGTDEKDREWRMKRGKLSPKYTTCWEEIAKAR